MAIELKGEWRFGNWTVTLIKGPAKHYVGFAQGRDGQISGTGCPLSWLVTVLTVVLFLAALAAHLARR